jgi:hypothetical protein
MSIILTVFNGVALGILVAWEEFSLPTLGAFRKKMLLMLSTTILIWVAVGVVVLYFLLRTRKSGAGPRLRGGGMGECEFCGGTIESIEARHTIKEHIVCAQCYARIEKEREQVRGESSP